MASGKETNGDILSLLKEQGKDATATLIGT